MKPSTLTPIAPVRAKIGATRKTSDTVPLPPLPDNAPGRPSNLRYREQYGIILKLTDAREQERVFQDLVKRGFKPRVVVT